VSTERLEELAANLEDVRARIVAAAQDAGRDPAEITLVVVTKTWPASDVRLLASLGITEVAENRDQEARPKFQECADLALRWHFIGQLQRNKARSVATYADVVESVDRAELIAALDHTATDLGRTIDVLVQIDLEVPPQPHRGGVAPAQAPALADLVASSDSLRLAGVMAVAPLEGSPREAFDRLIRLAAIVRADHPGAWTISAGMSGDLDAAIASGATHVRVGTAVLGRRALLR